MCYYTTTRHCFFTQLSAKMLSLARSLYWHKKEAGLCVAIKLASQERAANREQTLGPLIKEAFFKGESFRLLQEFNRLPY